MQQIIASPDKFSTLFNAVVPGAYRSITAQDIRDMTECGLIGRYKYYGRQDIETVRAILLYEQIRNERSEKACLKDAPRTCKRCGEPLPSQPDSSRGRPSEYCVNCEPFRGGERNRKWRDRQISVLSVH